MNIVVVVNIALEINDLQATSIFKNQLIDTTQIQLTQKLLRLWNEIYAKNFIKTDLTYHATCMKLKWKTFQSLGLRPANARNSRYLGRRSIKHEVGFYWSKNCALFFAVFLFF